MTPSMLSAIFTFGTLVVGLITGWLAQRYRKKNETRRDRAQDRQAIEQRFNDKLDSIIDRQHEQGKKLDQVSDDVVYLKQRVSVHDDRWDRAKLSLLAEGNGHAH